MKDTEMNEIWSLPSNIPGREKQRSWDKMFEDLGMVIPIIFVGGYVRNNFLRRMAEQWDNLLLFPDIKV